MASDTYHGLTDTRLVNLRGHGRWLFFRQMMWERDNRTCGICLQPLDPTEMDLDHIIPKAEGGLDHWDNLRATHLQCNRHRGGILATDRQRLQRLISKVATKVPVLLILPADVHAALTEWANQEDRSLNGQIVYLLRKAIAARSSP